MTDCTHDWRPIDGRCGCYKCALCPLYGRRDIVSGRMVPQKTEIKPDACPAYSTHTYKPLADEIRDPARYYRRAPYKWQADPRTCRRRPYMKERDE